jgi:hypothetical protein
MSAASGRRFCCLWVAQADRRVGFGAGRVAKITFPRRLKPRPKIARICRLYRLRKNPSSAGILEGFVTVPHRHSPTRAEMKPAEGVGALRPLLRGTQLRGPLGLGFLSLFFLLNLHSCFFLGHDLSRAANAIKSMWALAPEGCFSSSSPSTRPLSAACETRTLRPL